MAYPYDYYGIASAENDNNGFLNIAGWDVSGFIDPKEASRQARDVRRSAGNIARLYSWIVPFGLYYSDPYRSDESYGGNYYQYIPTEQQIGAGIAALNMQAANIRPGGEKINDFPGANNPAMQQLVQSLYQQAGTLYGELRKASQDNEGW